MARNLYTQDYLQNTLNEDDEELYPPPRDLQQPPRQTTMPVTPVPPIGVGAEGPPIAPPPKTTTKVPPAAGTAYGDTATTDGGKSTGTTGGTTTTGGARGYGGVSLTPRGGGGGGQWGGFNTERALAGGDPDSIKDAFYRFGQGFNFDPAGKSKEEIEAFLRSQIPAAKDYGLDIMDVKGEQIFIRTAENPEGTWVDVVGNAGGTGASPWQWIDQSYLGDIGGGGGGGATGGGGGADEGGGGTEDPLALGLGQSDIFRAIMNELAGVISGRSNTTQRNIQRSMNT